MSLKAFHVFFVAVAVLATSGFGAWAGWQVSQGASAAYGAVAGGSALFAAILVVYGVWFLRKLKHVRYV